MPTNNSGTKFLNNDGNVGVLLHSKDIWSSLATNNQDKIDMLFDPNLVFAISQIKKDIFIDKELVNNTIEHINNRFSFLNQNLINIDFLKGFKIEWIKPGRNFIIDIETEYLGNNRKILTEKIKHIDELNIFSAINLENNECYIDSSGKVAAIIKDGGYWTTLGENIQDQINMTFDPEIIKNFLRMENNEKYRTTILDEFDSTPNFNKKWENSHSDDSNTKENICKYIAIKYPFLSKNKKIDNSFDIRSYFNETVRKGKNGYGMGLYTNLQNIFCHFKIVFINKNDKIFVEQNYNGYRDIDEMKFIDNYNIFEP